MDLKICKRQNDPKPNKEAPLTHANAPRFACLSFHFMCLCVRFCISMSFLFYYTFNAIKQQETRIILNEWCKPVCFLFFFFCFILICVHFTLSCTWWIFYVVPYTFGMANDIDLPTKHTFLYLFHSVSMYKWKIQSYNN